MEPDEAGQNIPAPEVDRFLAGGGELPELFRRKDCSQASPGPIVRRLCGQFSRAGNGRSTIRRFSCRSEGSLQRPGLPAEAA